MCTYIYLSIPFTIHRLHISLIHLFLLSSSILMDPHEVPVYYCHDQRDKLYIFPWLVAVETGVLAIFCNLICCYH